MSSPFTMCYFSFCISSVVFSFHLDKSNQGFMDRYMTNGSQLCNATIGENNNVAKTILQNKRLVFIGDSLTRYQYLNFVHFLYTNSWFSPHPRSELEHEWESWDAFFKGTSARTGCYEICDCHRNSSHMGHETRHYHDPANNISIHFFLWLPPYISVKGFLKIPLSNEYYNICISGNETEKNDTFHYSHNNIVSFLNTIIRPLSPDAIIINQGFWMHTQLREGKNFHVFAKTLSEITLLPIWKTTTAVKDTAAAIDTDLIIAILQ
eukprot:gene13583-28840_t